MRPGGGCRFCGQIADIKAPLNYTDDQRDELATELCKCYEAEYYTNKKSWKERAHDRIEKLFGEESEEPINDSEIKILHDAVEPVANNDITSMTVDFGNGIKAKINITAKGKIKVQRTDTDTRSYEA